MRLRRDDGLAGVPRCDGPAGGAARRGSTSRWTSDTLHAVLAAPRSQHVALLAGPCAPLDDHVGAGQQQFLCSASTGSPRCAPERLRPTGRSPPTASSRRDTCAHRTRAPPRCAVDTVVFPEPGRPQSTVSLAMCGTVRRRLTAHSVEFPAPLVISSSMSTCSRAKPASSWRRTGRRRWTPTRGVSVVVDQRWAALRWPARVVRPRPHRRRQAKDVEAVFREAGAPGPGPGHRQPLGRHDAGVRQRRAEGAVHAAAAARRGGDVLALQRAGRRVRPRRHPHHRRPRR